MEIKPGGYWNDYNRCFEEAKKYNTRSSFQKGNVSAYKSSIRNKWIDEYTWMPKPKRKPNGYWTYERCYKEAKKYKTISIFYDNCSGACRVAKQNGWVNDYYWFESPHKERWTQEHCLEVAKQYTNLSDFRKNDLTAYVTAYKNGWIDDYVWIKRIKKRKGYWQNYDNCYNEAKKYTSRTEMMKKSSSCYSVAYKNGWLDDYYWLKNKSIDIVNGKVDSVYVYEFIDQHAAYIGRTLMMLQKNRDYSHIFRSDSVSNFANEHNISIPKMIILEDTLTIEEGKKREIFWIEEYRKNGWNVLNKVKGGAIGTLGKWKWTQEKCFNEAKKYTTLKDFYQQCKGAYIASLNKGWIKDYVWLKRKCNNEIIKWSYELCEKEAKKYEYKNIFYKENPNAYVAAVNHGWMKYFIWLKNKRKPNGYWTYERCYEESKKYHSIQEFLEGSSSAYQISRRKGWLKDWNLFSHQQVSSGYWCNYENCYKEAQKYIFLRDFANCSKTAYESSLRNNWLSDYFWLKRMKKPNGYWCNYENCYKEAQKYISKKDFKKYSYSAYYQANKKDWLDNFTWLV